MSEPLVPSPPLTLQAVLRHMRERYTRRLRFGPSLERQFAQACAPSRLTHLRLTATAALVLFNLFLISDYQMVPDVFELSVQLRLYTLTPLILAFVVIGHVLRDWWLQHTPPWLTDVIAMVGTMLVAACLAVVLMKTHSPLASVYRAGLIPVLVFCNLVQRLRFARALTASLFIMGLFVYTTVARDGPPSPYAIIEGPMGLLVVVVGVYTLVSNFNLEMDERLRFLQNERGLSLRAELEHIHGGLEELSNKDPLTGLPNRRRFDSYLQERQAKTLQQGTVVLLIDVDHFKAFNDRYGHPSGDQCLRMVAGALSRAMGGTPGLLARWGGEEFVAVLPGATLEAAMATAEGMRQAVTALRMRHESSTASPHVSVSIGVATGHMGLPLAEGRHELEHLMRRADEALYRAKAQGRNRCEAAPPSGPVN